MDMIQLCSSPNLIGLRLVSVNLRPVRRPMFRFGHRNRPLQEHIKCKYNCSSNREQNKLPGKEQLDEIIQ